MLISLFEKGEEREGSSSVSKASIFLVLLPALAALSEMLRDRGGRWPWMTGASSQEAHSFSMYSHIQTRYGQIWTSLVAQTVKNLRIYLQCRRHRRWRFDSWVGKIPWRRAWQPLQCSCLENPMDRGACRATAHGVTKSQTQCSN